MVFWCFHNHGFGFFNYFWFLNGFSIFNKGLSRAPKERLSALASLIWAERMPTDSYQSDSNFVSSQFRGWGSSERGDRMERGGYKGGGGGGWNQPMKGSSKGYDSKGYDSKGYDRSYDQGTGQTVWLPRLMALVRLIYLGFLEKIGPPIFMCIYLDIYTSGTCA